MPTIITDGAASAQGYGFAARTTAANYIEDVFSTYLYTGNGSTQTITNGINLSGKGGLVWTKCRSIANGSRLYDSERPSINPSSFAKPALTTNGTNGNLDYQDGITTFNADGFLIQDLSGAGGTQANANGATYASWTFRKQAKFFDVVTYTGTGVARTIAHNLGSVPGCIIVKRTDSTGDFNVYHRGLTSAAYYIRLNLTTAEGSLPQMWNGDAPTASVFSVGTGSANTNGATYVAYLFAHNAGGFGASGLDNVISCGSYTGNGSTTGPTITLGYEPQWLLTKRASGATSNWFITDNMRGMPVSGNEYQLYPNLSSAESYDSPVPYSPTATGFNVTSSGSDYNASAATYIYIAIRRGPMKTPTSGTSVFVPVAGTGSYSGVTMTTNFPADAVLDNKRNGTGDHYLFDRLRSTYGTNYLATASTAAEGSGATQYMIMDSNTTVINKNWANDISNTFVSWIFRRAPGFFDVVCYTGNSTAGRTVNHNLGATPELMIVKRRNDVGSWLTYSATLGNTYQLKLESTIAQDGPTSSWNSTSPTNTVFSLGSNPGVNGSGDTYVAYLFATVAGVSKVGSYTGTGTTQQINCGFTGGARFVLIKRTDSTGDWYVWDSARGIVAGNDPYLLLNSTAAEVTGTDYVDTYAAGFEISSTAPAAINANGGTFIFLAIA